MATEPIPADWAWWRDRWEFGHAAVAGVKGVGFCALLLSVIVEAPAWADQERKTYQQAQRKEITHASQ
jgi:hypothetical protein